MSGFQIELQMDDSWTPPARTALEQAAATWMAVITGRLPPVMAQGRRAEDLLVFASVAAQDGAGGTFARAGPLDLRPASAGAAAYLPATGELYLDAGDVATLSADGRLQRVLTHELGHILGVGTIWNYKGLIAGAGTSDPTFLGGNAKIEYGRLKGGAPLAVPVENVGGQGAANRHWRESSVGVELMSTYLPTAHNPLSRLTIASLEDLGYEVSYAAAETFALNALWALPADTEEPPPRHELSRTKPRILPMSALLSPPDA